MFLFNSLYIFSIIVTLHKTVCEKRTCHMVSVEIENGLTGYCCIFVKNNSVNNIQVDEIKGQLLDHLTNDTIDEVFNKNIEVGDKYANGTTSIVKYKINHVNIKLPSTTNNEELKSNGTIIKGMVTHSVHNDSNASKEYKNKLVSEAQTGQDDTSTEVSQTPNVTPDEEKDARNDTVTVIPVNRNAVDIPETCPEGKEKDHNGECVPVY